MFAILFIVVFIACTSRRLNPPTPGEFDTAANNQVTVLWFLKKFLIHLLLIIAIMDDKLYLIQRNHQLYFGGSTAVAFFTLRDEEFAQVIFQGYVSTAMGSAHSNYRRTQSRSGTNWESQLVTFGRFKT